MGYLLSHPFRVASGTFDRIFHTEKKAIQMFDERGVGVKNPLKF